MLRNHIQDDLGRRGNHIKEEYKNMSINTGKCLYKVIDGYFTTTMKMLESSKVPQIMETR